ncbi:ABC transporter permease [Paraclostridium ghonii]|uniref:ABC-2 type transport system permease protein n=1 Tax=Paraclostridium ghonii TaxID=29358 RepID=A0ABU0N052_9FIRM|nr:ABC transporter permease [Paeniclostridium ghonii]MDQ0556533.1 ABC-2 type transport system permease protein [Paeniclostridium ghonii]
MRTIFIVFKANYKRAMNQKGRLLINVFLPLIAIVLSMFANYIGSTSVNIGILEKENFVEGKRIISLLKNTNGINIKTVNEDYIKTNAILGKYDGVITFKKEFKQGEKIDINECFDFYTIKDSKLKSGMKDVVKVYLVSNDTISLKGLEKEVQDGALSKAERIISFLATVLLITCVINGAVIIKDKYENTISRFMYSPNSRMQYILGNILYSYTICYLQLFLAIIITHIFGMNIGLSVKVLLLYGLLLSLLTTTFGAFIACLFKKELHANIFAGAIGLILSLIGGAFISYDKMPKGLQHISNFTPTRWIIKSVNWLEHGNVNNINPILILVVFCVVFSIAATLANKLQKVDF